MSENSEIAHLHYGKPANWKDHGVSGRLAMKSSTQLWRIACTLDREEESYGSMVFERRNDITFLFRNLENLFLDVSNDIQSCNRE